LSFNCDSANGTKYLVCFLLFNFSISERPHGNIVFAPILLTTIAFVFSFAASRGCDYVYREYVSNDDRYPFFVEGDGQGAGMWTYQGTTGYCYYYPSQMYTGTKFNSARVFNTWVSCVGAVVMILMWFSICCGLGRLAWILMGFFLMINCLFEGLGFLFFSSEICNPTYGICSLTRASRFGISAVVLWFLAGASVAKVAPPAGPELPDTDVIQQTTTTERVEPDGTRVTATVTTTTSVYS